MDFGILGSIPLWFEFVFVSFCLSVRRVAAGLASREPYKQSCANIHSTKEEGRLAIHRNAQALKEGKPNTYWLIQYNSTKGRYMRIVYNIYCN